MMLRSDTASNPFWEKSRSAVSRIRVLVSVFGISFKRLFQIRFS